MKAYPGGKAELMLYATVDLEPHALPRLAPSFRLQGTTGDSRRVTDTRRHSAWAGGLQDTIATFARRVAIDPWICPDNFPLHPNQGAGRMPSGFSTECTDLPYGSTSATPGVDQTDAAYFGSRMTELTDFPSASSQWGGDEPGKTIVFDGHPVELSQPPPPKSPMPPQPPPPKSPRPPAPPTNSRPVSAAPPHMPLRTSVDTTPLFVGSVKLDASGRAKVQFTAPDNIARFAVRAVVVGDTAAPGVFAETETHLIVRKPLSLLPSQPRIVRSQDKFNCGVTVTLQDANFDGTKASRCRSDSVQRKI